MQTDEQRDVCNGDHTRIKVSDVFGEGAPAPPWPLPDAPTHCVCGAELEYRHSINEIRLRWLDPDE